MLKEKEEEDKEDDEEKAAMAQAKNPSPSKNFPLLPLTSLPYSSPLILLSLPTSVTDPLPGRCNICRGGVLLSPLSCSRGKWRVLALSVAGEPS